MPTYTFSLHLSAPPTDAQIDKLFDAGIDDGLPGTTNGAGIIDFDRDAPSLAQAISSAINDVQKVPGISVMRVSPDELVTASEIAERTGRSRESIRLLATGRRGAGDFPSPAARAGERSPLWRWSDIMAWNGSPDPDALAVELINASLSLRHIVAQAPAQLVDELRPLIASAKPRRQRAA